MLCICVQSSSVSQSALCVLIDRQSDRPTHRLPPFTHYLRPVSTTHSPSRSLLALPLLPATLTHTISRCLALFCLCSCSIAGRIRKFKSLAHSGMVSTFPRATTNDDDATRCVKPPKTTTKTRSGKINLGTFLHTDECQRAYELFAVKQIYAHRPGSDKFRYTGTSEMQTRRGEEKAICKYHLYLLPLFLGSLPLHDCWLVPDIYDNYYSPIPMPNTRDELMSHSLSLDKRYIHNSEK